MPSGTRSRVRKRSRQQSASTPSPADHAREALEEWRTAFRLGTAALLPAVKRAGNAADAVLARFGAIGKLAAKASLASPAAEGPLPGGAGAVVDVAPEASNGAAGSQGSPHG